MKEELDTIGRLLTDCSVNFIEAENDDEKFGALLMLGELQKRIYPILTKIREANNVPRYLGKSSSVYFESYSALGEV